jgi:hypothetical protein
MVENLISEHNITDLADLMKVSEQAAAGADARVPRPGDLMAVFTRPAATSELCPRDFAFVAEDVQVLTALLKNAVARKEPASTCCCTARPAPARPSWPRWRRRRRALAVRGGIRRPRWQQLSGRDRYRSLQISQVFLKGSADVALLFDEVEDVFPPISRRRRPDGAAGHGRWRAGSGSVSGKAWVNQILEPTRCR